jgi:pyruvate,water dikinase
MVFRKGNRHERKAGRGYSSEIGGKARGLLFLEEKGFRTAAFYILEYSVLSDFLSGKTGMIDVLKAAVPEYSEESDRLWAVRSSVDIEDGETRSFAGFFNTVVNVPTKGLEQAVKQVLESYSRVNETLEGKQNETKFGIVVQEMIRSEYSGVVFSHHPENIKDETIHINVIPGLGENLVSGKEEGFLITRNKGKFTYHYPEALYSGEVFTDSLHKIEKTGTDMIADIRKHLHALVKGTNRLVKLKKCPVDIEFTIADGYLWWLQVRPITTGKTEPQIWDNTATEGNYPGIMMPLSISLIRNSFYLGYKGLATYLGMPKTVLAGNEHRLKEIAGEINGSLYYNVTAWQKTVSILPFGLKISRALPKVWGMERAEFVADRYRFGMMIKAKLLFRLIGSMLFLGKGKRIFIKNHEQVHAYFETIDFSGKSRAELAALYKELELRLTGRWVAPLLNNLFTVVLMMVSKKTIGRSRLAERYPNFMNDALFAAGDVISAVIFRAFKSILNTIREHSVAMELFMNHTPEVVFERLRSEHPELYASVMGYIETYGERSEEPELKMETVNYKEDPIRFIAFLKENLNYETPLKSLSEPFDYRAIIQTTYRYKPVRRFLLMQLTRHTITQIKNRENFRFMRTRSYGIVRSIVRAMDAKLHAEGLISEPGDSLYLSFDELMDTSNTLSYKTLISERKLLYETYRKVERFTRYTQNETGLKPVSVQTASDDASLIMGTGCCSGVVKAEVKVFDNTMTGIDGHEGKIFVANYFEPGKLGLFSKAGGLISARGNLLGHTAILCREMGLPSIVGAKGLLSRLKDGDVVEMNGGTGEVKIITY